MSYTLQLLESHVPNKHSLPFEPYHAVIAGFTL